MFGFLPTLLLLVDIVAMTFLLLVQLTSKHRFIVVMVMQVFFILLL